jgi:hypothetical protein
MSEHLQKWAIENQPSPKKQVDELSNEESKQRFNAA